MTLNRLWLLLCAPGVFAAACGGSEFGAADETIAKDDGATSQGAGGSDGNGNGGALASDGGSTSGGSGGRATGSSPGSGGARNTGGTPSTGGVPSAGGAPSGDGGAGVSTDGGTGTAGAPSTDASTDGPFGAGGTPGAGGDPNGAGGDLGTGGDPNGAGGACQSPPTWFPDDDQDGYGRSTGTVVACDPPSNGHWATVGADCNDDDDRVHPNQTTYFTDVYSTPGGGGSFDYDCASGEQGNPDQGGAMPACLALPIGCTGSGWVKTTRTAPGQNSLCGSFTRATCQIRQLVCQAIPFQVTDGYACR